MAAKKKASRRPRQSVEAIEQMVRQVDAYIAEHPGTAAAGAHRAIGATVPVKNYYQLKRRRGNGEIPLDAIPQRERKSNPSAHAIAKRRRSTEVGTALDLLRMALRILERAID